MTQRIRDSGKIRVCHLASGDLWAGAEVQIAMLLPQLSRNQELDISVVLLNNGRLAEELQRKDIPVVIFDESTLSSLQILKRLVAYFAQHRVDILHTHRYKEHVLGSTAAKSARVRNIVKTVHGLEEPFSGARRWKMAFYAYLDNLIEKYLTDAIIAVSDDIRRVLAKRLRTPVITIHNGIDLDRVKPRVGPELVRKSLGIDSGSYVIGTIGRIVPVKGLDYFLSAAEVILGEIQNVHFLIVGEGPYRKHLEQMAQQKGLGKNVIFAGHREDVYDLLNAMDIFVLPSFHEGVPTVLLEAMALQKPIIATDVGGVPEIITDGETGFLVPPKSVKFLADRIVYVIRNLDEARRLIRLARTQVEEEFSTVQQVNKLFMLYVDIVRSNGNFKHSGANTTQG
jgi:glycosyltransferase involved in cell wall biosynthesis